MNIKDVKKPQELLESDFADSPYDFQRFISVEKMADRSAARHKLKILRVVDPAVRQILLPGERVFFVTRGLRVSNFEQLFIGWASYYYNLMAFVFTDRRILLIHLKHGKCRGSYIGCIRYTDIQKVKGGGLLGNFRLKFVNGKNMLFVKIPKRDQIFLRDLLSRVVQDRETDKAAPDIRNLCPRCFQEVLSYPDSCGSCELGFKTPRRAARLSLIMPGLGDIYLGHTLLGTMEFLVMLYLWFCFAAAAYGDYAAGYDMTGSLLVMGFFWVLVHPMDALKANYLAKKGIAPLKAYKYAGE